eukprot:scaffold268741_cov28-Prasinocladus_malaysianus.AAC.2
MVCTMSAIKPAGLGLGLVPQARTRTASSLSTTSSTRCCLKPTAARRIVRVSASAATPTAPTAPASGNGASAPAGELLALPICFAFAFIYQRCRPSRGRLHWFPTPKND